MKESQFLISNLLVAVLLIAIYMVLVYGFGQVYIWPVPAVILVFALMNMMFLRMLKKSEKKSPQRFVAAFTGVIAIKLMVAMTLTLVYILLFEENRIPFVAALFVAYMSFTILLVRTAMKHRPGAE